MKDIIAKFEELLSTNEYKFYKDGVQDCIKVVKDYLTSHKTRQPIQVTEGDFEQIGEYVYSFNKDNLEIYIGEFYSEGEDKKIIQIFKNETMPCEEYYSGDLLKDGVIAVNVALRKMYEDVSEVIE